MTPPPSDPDPDRAPPSAGPVGTGRRAAPESGAASPGTGASSSPGTGASESHGTGASESPGTAAPEPPRAAAPPEPGGGAPAEPGAARPAPSGPGLRGGGTEGARPRFLRRRRAEALAGLIPIAGFFMLMPPFVRIFAHDGRLFGAPVALVFLLALWLGGILATRLLARRLLRPDPEP